MNDIFEDYAYNKYGKQLKEKEKEFNNFIDTVITGAIQILKLSDEQIINMYHIRMEDLEKIKKRCGL